jgi:hypothetical protein
MSIPGRYSTVAMLVRAGFVVVLVPVNVSGFRPVLARGWHGQTSSLSGNCPSWACFRILPVSCREWSAQIRWCPALSGAIVKQLVTRLGPLRLAWRRR